MTSLAREPVRTPFAIRALTSALVLGYFLGRARAPAGALEPRAPATPLPGARSSPGGADTRAGDEASSRSTALTRADRDAHLRLEFARASAAEFETRAREILRRAPSRERDDLAAIVYEFWGRRNPAAAIAGARQEPILRRREHAMAQVLAGWTAVEPSAALQWVAANDTPGARLAIATALAELPGETTLALARSLPPGFPLGREVHLAAIDATTRSGDYAAGRDIVNAIADHEVRGRAAARLADQWARHSPQAAAEWAVTVPSPESGAQILASVGTIWAAQDPRGAADFARVMPAGQARQTLLTNVVLYWAANDIVGASRWLDQLDAHPDNDPAMAAIATDSRLVSRNPETALSWAESIAGEARRHEAIQLIVGAWALRDQEAATRYLRDTPVLPAATRSQLLAGLGRVPRSD